MGHISGTWELCMMDWTQDILNITFEEDHPGLTKSGEVGDFFALVSMKSPNFCQKAKF
jgi:hypothetical protein